MTGIKLLDSSVWIDFLSSGKHKDIVEGSHTLLISALSLFEIRKKLFGKGYNINDVEKSMDYVRGKSLVISVDEQIAEKAVEVSVKNKIPMADSIIYVTALEHDAIVYTLDNHFRKLEKAKVLD
jgi:toxin FitB